MTHQEKKLKSYIRLTRGSLHTAITNGKINIIKSLLIRGAALEAVDKFDQTALHVAAAKGDETIVKLLLEYKADVSAKDYQGKTPLHFAAEGGHLKVTKKLFSKSKTDEKFVNINARTLDKETPLHLAALKGHAKLVKYLVDHGAKIDAGDKFTATPLHLAAATGNSKTVRELLNCGANINRKTKNGFTVLHCVVLEETFLDKQIMYYQRMTTKLNKAQVLRQLEVLNVLLEKGVLNLVVGDEDGLSPLHFAALRNHVILLEKILDCGIDIDLKDKRERTPLHHAAGQNSTRVIRILLNAGANVNLMCSRGFTPIHSAINRSRMKNISMLLSAGADINARTPSGESVFDMLLSHDLNINLLNLVIECGADVNARNENGRNILHDLSNEFKFIDFSGVLIGRFLDFNAEDVNLKTPLYYALEDFCEYRDEEYVDFIIRAIVKMESANNFKMNQQNAYIMSLVLEIFYNRYKVELEELKKKKVWGHISFYDLLIKPIEQLIEYARNKELIEILDSGVCEQFEAYGDLIESRMRMALTRKNLLEMSLEVLTRLFNPQRGIKLPRYVGLHALSYLNSIDLKSLSKA